MRRPPIPDMKPLTAAVDALAPELPESAIEPLRAGAFLAELIDARGSVALAERLAEIADDAPDATVSIRRGDADSAARIASATAEEIEAIGDRFESAFELAFRPRYRLPTPAQALAVLRETSAIPDRDASPMPNGRASKRVRRKAAERLWTPVGDFIDMQYRRVRLGLRELRDEIGPDLRALGPQAARLERVEAALDEATRHPQERLLRRMVRACEQHFVRAVEETVRSLPPGAGAAALTPHFTADGWLGAHIARAHIVVRGVYDHDRRRLTALVEAAIGARSG